MQSNVVFDYAAAATGETVLVTDAFCTSDLLYASVGATYAQEYFWCGTPGEIGQDYYLGSLKQTHRLSNSG